MKTRAITGFFFIIVLVLATVWNAYVFVAFFALLGVLASREFFEIVRSDETNPLLPLGLLNATVLAVLTGGYFLFDFQASYFLWSILTSVLLFIASLYRKSPKPFHDIGYTLLGVVYGTLPFLFFIGLGFTSGTFVASIPMGFLIILWSNDTGAYLTGRFFGRTKLFERISPNKTWEGFIGGVLIALLISLSFPLFWSQGLSRVEWGIIAVIVGVFGTLGDLVESMLKRSLGIKDSGNILPGHGGILDRFDGLLIAAPLVYLFLTTL